MVVGMSKRVWYAQKTLRIIKIKSFKGMRGITKVEHHHNMALLIVYLVEL